MASHDANARLALVIALCGLMALPANAANTKAKTAQNSGAFFEVRRPSFISEVSSWQNQVDLVSTNTKISLISTTIVYGIGMGYELQSKPYSLQMGGVFLYGGSSVKSTYGSSYTYQQSGVTTIGGALRPSIRFNRSKNRAFFGFGFPVQKTNTQYESPAGFNVSSTNTWSFGPTFQMGWKFESKKIKLEAGYLVGLKNLFWSIGLDWTL